MHEQNIYVEHAIFHQYLNKHDILNTSNLKSPIFFFSFSPNVMFHFTNDELDILFNLVFTLFFFCFFLCSVGVVFVVVCVAKWESFFYASICWLPISCVVFSFDLV